MRQRATWLVVVALAALGTAAGVDALRGKETPPEQPKQAEKRTTTGTPEKASSVVELGPAPGLNGILYYTGPDCRVRALRLPGLEQGVAPQAGECEFSLSPSGRAIQPSWVVWSPDGSTYAEENGDQVDVDSGREHFRGSDPAWRPDGTLTYMAGGALRARPGGRILLSEADLRRAAVRHPNVPETNDAIDYVRAKQVGWLSRTRVVLLLAIGIRTVGEFDVTAVFERRRLVTTVAAFQAFEQLWTSPQGGLFALGGNGTIQLYDRRGKARPLPLLTGPRAIAWSPDETWAAVATRASIYLIRMGRATPRVRRLAIEAHALAWRASGAPELGATASLARWLGRAGVRGRLYFSGRDCRARSLRMPDLVWSDPEGMRGPCRFSIMPDGTISDEWVVWQARGRLGAGCHANAVDVFAQGDRSLFHRGGACSPAWKPDGSLTYVVGGQLVLAARLRAERVLVSREDLAAAFGRGAKLREVAWIDDRQFGAAVRQGSRTVYAVFYEGELVARPSFSAASIAGLRSNGRGIVAARTDSGRRATTFFDLRGRPLWSMPGGRALAWSPGGAVAALSRGTSLLLVDPLSREVHRLPVFAADVEWR
jgi:hypothetical protein